MQWNPDVLSKFVAPGIGGFTAAEVPSLSDQFPQAPHWVVNHFLNSALRSSFRDGWRQVALGYLRRTHNAFVYYHDARLRTDSYLEGNDPHNPRVGRYYDAVSAWENFALQVSMAIDLFRWLNQGEGAFRKGDGTKEQRLYDIANCIKHTAGKVDSGQCGPSDTVPLWLTNLGLSSFGISVAYSEAADVLVDLAKLADEYQDPHSLREKLQREREMQSNNSLERSREQ